MKNAEKVPRKIGMRLKRTTDGRVIERQPVWAATDLPSHRLTHKSKLTRQSNRQKFINAAINLRHNVPAVTSSRFCFYFLSFYHMFRLSFCLHWSSGLPFLLAHIRMSAPAIPFDLDFSIIMEYDEYALAKRLRDGARHIRTLWTHEIAKDTIVVDSPHRDTDKSRMKYSDGSWIVLFTRSLCKYFVWDEHWASFLLVLFTVCYRHCRKNPNFLCAHMESKDCLILNSVVIAPSSKWVSSKYFNLINSFRSLPCKYVIKVHFLQNGTAISANWIVETRIICAFPIPSGQINSRNCLPSKYCVLNLTAKEIAHDDLLIINKTIPPNRKQYNK